jgi:hypothetical protein
MTRFEYEITVHSTEEFSQLVYFCTDEGECSTRELPSDQINAFEQMINQRGSAGWELIQIFFRKDGAVVFWKKVL